MNTHNITAKQLLDGIRDGEITVSADDAFLQVPAGASFDDGSACIDTFLRLLTNGEELLALPVWGWGGWQDGHLKSGEPGMYTGYDDGHFTGSVRCEFYAEDGMITIKGGDHVDDAGTDLPSGVSGDEGYQVAEELERAVNEVLPPIELPSDAEEMDWLLSQSNKGVDWLAASEDAEITDSLNEPDGPFVEVCWGQSLDRTIYVVGDEIYDDPKDAAAEAKRLLADLLEEARDNLESFEYHPGSGDDWSY